MELAFGTHRFAQPPEPIRRPATLRPPQWDLDTAAHLRIKLHPWTVKALTETPPLQRADVQRVASITLATDGSGAGMYDNNDQRAPAWGAAAIVTLESGEQRYVGLMAARVCKPDDAGWIGTANTDVLAAEVTAIFWALAWAMTAFPGVPIKVVYDNMAAANGSCLRNAWQKEEKLQALLFALVRQSASIEWEHVYSHTGHPWNELADSASTAASEGSFFAQPPKWQQLQDVVRDVDQLRWAWIATETENYRRALPQFHSRPVIQRRPPTATEPDDRQSQAGAADSTVRLKGLFFNTCTLVDVRNCQSRPGLQQPNRAATVAAQLENIGVNLAILAETRLPAAERTSGAFLVWATGPAAHATGGMEIWLSKKVPYAMANDTELFFAREHLAMACSQSDMFFAVLRAPALKLDIAAGHAPHQRAKKEVKAKWWKAFRDMVRRHATAGVACICGLDANARYGSETSTAIGELGAETQCFSGQELHRFALDWNLFLPGTFEANHTGRTATWTPTAQDGVRTRNDAWLLPSTWADAVTSFNLHVDSLIAWEDHDAVVFCAELQTCRQKTQRRPFRPDRSSLQDPRARQQFEAELAKIQQPDWHQDVHEHADSINKAITAAAKNAFPSKARAPRKPFIQEATWQMICDRRKIAAQLRRLKRRAALDPDPQLSSEMENTRQQWKDARKPLVKALWADKAKQLEDVLTAYEDAPQSLRQQKLREALRWHRGNSGRAKGPRALVPAQPLADGPEDRARKWLEHFSRIEAADITTPEALLDSCIVRQNDKAGHQAPTEFGCVTTLVQLHHAFASLPAKKAPGPDGQTTDLFLAAPAAMARVYLPLYAKCDVRKQEPMAWKGGYAHPLHKGGPPLLRDSYRSIMLANTAGKTYHSLHRRRLNSFWEQTALESQHGGRRHQSTDFATHKLRIFWHMGQQQHRSTAIFFIDVKAAFYSVLREFIFGAPADAETLARLCMRLAVPPETHQQLIHNLASFQPLLPRDHQLHDLVEEQHASTHFGIRSLDHCTAATKKGTRPGDPWGDIIWNILMASIAKEIDAQLIEQGLVDAMPCADIGLGKEVGGRVHIPGVIFVDDHAVPISTDDPALLLSKLSKVASIVITTLQKHGLTTNMLPTKTAALVCFRGRGSKQQFADAYGQSEPGIDVPTPSGSKRLPLVTQYKHLGGIIAQTGRMAPEIVQRQGASRTSWQHAKKAVLTKRLIPINVRRGVIEGDIMASTLFNCHTWSKLHEDDLHCLKTHLFKNATTLLGKDPTKDPPTTLQAHAETRSATLDDWMHYQRLAYLARAVQHGGQQLMALLVAEANGPDAWLSNLTGAAAWLQMHRPGMAIITTANYTHLVERILHDPRKWKSEIKAAKLAATGQRWAAQPGHDVTKHVSYLRGGPELEAQDQRGAPALACTVCGKAFYTQQQLRAHSFRLHQKRRTARYFAWTSACLACGKQWHTRARLIMHLTRGAGTDCLKRLQAWTTPMTEDELVDLEKKASMAPNAPKAAKATAAVHRLPVVCPPFCPLPPPPVGQQLPQLMDQIADQPDDSEEDYTQWGGRSFPSVIRPQPEKRYVLYIFSGRRRDGDLAMQKVLLDNNIEVLPVDLVYGKHCDLTSKVALGKWIDAIRSGRIAGVICSPPCETWSIARFLGLKENKGPTPLRSSANPWALPGLGEKKWQQIRIANLLLAAALRLVVESAMAGGFALLEHPAAPQTPEAPSIWRTAVLRDLCAIPGMSTLSFKQGPLGQRSPKPTTFLLMRLDTLSGHITRLQLPREDWPKPNMMGKDSKEAGYRTAPLKEYPPRLNEAIAHAMVDTINAAAVATDVPQEDDFITQHLAALHTCTDIGPDYVAPDAGSAVGEVQLARDKAKLDKILFADFRGDEVPQDERATSSCTARPSQPSSAQQPEPKRQRVTAMRTLPWRTGGGRLQNWP